MKFSEIIEGPSSQEGTLMTLLQYLLAKANMTGESKTSLKVPTDAVIRMLNNAGAAFSYADLNALVTSSERVGAIVKNISPQELEIGNDTEEEIELGGDAQAPQVDPGDAQVEKMANRASSARQP